MKPSVIRMGIAAALGALVLQGAAVANASEKCDSSQNQLMANGRPAWTKGVKELTWYNAGATQYDPAIVEGATAFEHRYGIHVKVVGIPETDYYTKAARLLATGDTTYDNFDMYTAFPMPEWAQRGWIAPVDCAVPKYLSKQWPAEIWKAAEYQGSHYFVPHLLQPFVFLWNKKLFKEAGLDPDSPPANLKELVADAKKLTKDTDGDGNVDQWGFVFPAGKIQRVPILTYAYFLGMEGGHLWNDDGSAGFDNDTGVKAMQLMVDLVQKDKVSPVSVINYDTGSAADIFSSGGSAMTMHFIGHPVVKEREALGADTVGGAAPPSAEGVTPQYPLGLVGPAQYVNAKSAHPLAAAHLAAFMGTYQQSWRESVLERNVGANVNVWSSPVLTDSKFAYLHDGFPFANAVKTIVNNAYVPAHKGLLVAMDVFREGMDAAITGKKSAKEAVDFIVSNLRDKGVTE